MTTKKQFLSSRERYQPITLPQEFSDEEMVRDWTLSAADREEIGKHRKSSRLWWMGNDAPIATPMASTPL